MPDTAAVQKGNMFAFGKAQKGTDQFVNSKIYLPHASDSSTLVPLRVGQANNCT